MRFFTNERELILLGSEYLRWVGCSWLLSAVSQVYLTFMKNCGAVHLSTVISSVTALLLLALSPVIVGMVDMTFEAKGYLRGMMVMCSYYLVGKSVNSMTIGGIFPAGGDSGFGLVCDAVTLWCVTVPLGFLCAFVFKMPVLAVYFVLNLDEIVKLPAVYRHYRKYGWVKNITES